MTNILLMSNSKKALEIATALTSSHSASVLVAENRRKGLSCLRRDEYTMVVIDLSMAREDVVKDLLYQNAPGSTTLEIHISTLSVEQSLRYIRNALARRERDHSAARRTATDALHGELNGLLTGILLQSELAIKRPHTDHFVAFENIAALAGDLRDRLRV